MNNKCCICTNNIPEERIEALNILGILSNNYTCISCASVVIKPYKGVYVGQSGISPLILANSLGQYGIEKAALKEEEEILDENN